MLFHHVVKNFVIQVGDPQAPVEDWTLGKIQSRRALRFFFMLQIYTIFSISLNMCVVTV